MMRASGVEKREAAVSVASVGKAIEGGRAWRWRKEEWKRGGVRVEEEHVDRWCRREE
jgi:hypothetical protein